jgi:hypothetical protein
MIYEVLLAIINDQQRLEGKRIVRLYMSMDIADKFLMEIVNKGHTAQPFAEIRWEANYAVPESHIGVLFKGEKQYKQLKVEIDDGAA